MVLRDRKIRIKENSVYVTKKIGTEEVYLKEGRYHRIDGPAVTQYNTQGEFVCEFWYLNGILHRDSLDGPAYTWTNNKGTWIWKYCEMGRTDLLDCATWVKKENGKYFECLNEYLTKESWSEMNIF